MVTNIKCTVNQLNVWLFLLTFDIYFLPTKSNKFNINLDIPAEETLLYDENTKNDFVDFIKATADIYKPSYTEMRFGFEVTMYIMNR